MHGIEQRGRGETAGEDRRKERRGTYIFFSIYILTLWSGLEIIICRV
jgi:hypothetical protein